MRFWKVSLGIVAGAILLAFTGAGGYALWVGAPQDAAIDLDAMAEDLVPPIPVEPGHVAHDLLHNQREETKQRLVASEVLAPPGTPTLAKGLVMVLVPGTALAALCAAWVVLLAKRNPGWEAIVVKVVASLVLATIATATGAVFAQCGGWVTLPDVLWWLPRAAAIAAPAFWLVLMIVVAVTARKP